MTSWLREVMNKLEIDGSESNKTAFLKGAAEGAIESLVVVGAMVIIKNMTGINLLKFRKG